MVINAEQKLRRSASNLAACPQTVATLNVQVAGRGRLRALDLKAEHWHTIGSECCLPVALSFKEHGSSEEERGL